MIIRAGRRADISQIIEVELSAGEIFTGTHMAWAAGQTSARSKLGVAADSGNLWVAADGVRLAGFLIGETLDGSFYIDEVAVAHMYQRRGVGRMLIDAAIAEAARRGQSAVTLTTDRTLAWNAPYYLRLGFRALAAREITPGLAARLGAQPSPERRCAMQFDLPPR